MAQDHTPSLSELKADAKALRQSLASQGKTITHAQALERVAQWHGARDWNTLSARIKRAAAQPFVGVGERLRGRYMGHSFCGKVISLTALSHGELHRITVHLDEPVDVVPFESFSVLRQRITATVGRDGVSRARRSDGVPHLQLEGAADCAG